MSELPPGAHSHKGSFPNRNRILAAISTLTIIVEAPLRQWRAHHRGTRDQARTRRRRRPRSHRLAAEPGEQPAAARRRAPHRVDRRRAEPRQARTAAARRSTRGRRGGDARMERARPWRREPRRAVREVRASRGAVPDRGDRPGTAWSRRMRPHRRGSSTLSGGHISACLLDTSTSTSPSAPGAASYCDFSIAVRRDVPVDEYVSAVSRELEIRFDGADRWAVSTLYLGGGTPSRLGAAGVSRLLDALAKRIEVEPGGEVTLEANPDDVSLDAARAWRAAGVNRLSIGAQSFDDRVLEWMHRTHDAAQIGRAVDAAREAGIEDLSIDLIFSLPDNVERSWSTDLERALAARAHTRVIVRAHDRAAHAARPLERARRGGGATGRAVRDGVSDGARDRSRTPGSSTTRCRTSRDRGTAHATIRRTGRGFHTSAWARRRTVSTASSGDGTRRRTPNGSAAVAAGLDPLAGRELLTADDVAAERTYLGLRTNGGLTLANDETRARLSVGGPGMGHPSRRQSAGSDPAGVAPPGRPRRRLDSRAKSLLCLKLWHQSSSTSVSAVCSRP